MKTNLYCCHHQCSKSGAPNWVSFIPHTVLSLSLCPPTKCKLECHSLQARAEGGNLVNHFKFPQREKGTWATQEGGGASCWLLRKRRMKGGGWQLWTHTLPTLSRLGFIDSCFAADVRSRGTNMIIKTSLEKTVKLWFVVNAAFRNWQEDGFGVQPTYINPLFYIF